MFLLSLSLRSSLSLSQNVFVSKSQQNSSLTVKILSSFVVPTPNKILPSPSLHWDISKRWTAKQTPYGFGFWKSILHLLPSLSTQHPVEYRKRKWTNKNNNQDLGGWDERGRCVLFCLCFFFLPLLFQIIHFQCKFYRA